MGNYLELVALFIIPASIIGWEWWSTCDSPDDELEWLTMLSGNFFVGNVELVIFNRTATTAERVQIFRDLSRKRWLRKFSWKMRYQTYLKNMVGVINK